MIRLELLSARATEKALVRLMAEYDEFHWAVAWGSFSGHGQSLLRHKAKFRSVTIGVAFSQTDPDLIDALVGVKQASVATKFPGGAYHPKVYCFRSGDRTAAIVGSANFTKGGLGKNLEAAVLITGDATDQIFQDLFSFIRESAQYSQPISKDFATAYRATCKRVARLEKPPRDPVPGIDTVFVKQATSALVAMTWEEYLREIRSSKHHDVRKSLRLLRIAQEWFASVPSFAHLDTARRKAIAGTLGKYQKLDAQLDREWGWFGSMRGMGDFANRIEENDRFIARAIDSIPRHGEVSRGQYEQFVESFIRAFERSARVGGVPTASRLLAMKRPDTFVCVCGPNIVQASEAMGFARTTLDLGNYWDRVVEAVCISEWYNSPRPSGRNAELWDSRVAMLDAIYYRP